MGKINRVVKHFHKHKIKTIIILILIAFLTTIALFLFAPIKSFKEKTSTIPDSSVKNKIDVSTQPLIYEFIMTINSDKDTPRFVYYTPESDEDRLIALNDQIIANLSKNGKITDSTNSYLIDYFSDKEVASIYYDKIKEEGLSQIYRLRLISSYVASMSYSKQTNINHLFMVREGKIIKQY